MVSLCLRTRTYTGEICLRVISGSARGLKLMSLDGLDTRPTLDRVKEALFSMLAPFIPSARVLDLFAGSGALGIEALSRGCEEAVFVDSLPGAMDIVRKNVSLARVGDRASFFVTEAESYLKKASGQFGVIFLDPPYNSKLYEPSLSIIASRSLLKADGVISLEWDSALSPPPVPPQFSVIKERRYGRVMLTLLSLND